LSPESLLNNVQREILRALRQNKASYAFPLSSDRLSKELHVTPSYVREQTRAMREKGMVQVRRGPGGGYFIIAEEEY